MRNFTLIICALFGIVFNANAVTIDEVCGAYTQNLSFEWYDYNTYTITDKVVISKVDDTNLTISGFWSPSSSLKATFDAESQTISIPSFQSVAYADYSWALYGVTYENDKNGEVCTLKFSIDNTDGITLTALSQPTLGYDYYGDGTYYDYSYYGKATLTRTGDVTATTFTCSSLVDTYTDAGEIAATLFKGNVEITKYEGGIYDYRIANWCGTNEDILLTIAENGAYTIAGGDEYNGYSYYYYLTTEKDCISPYYADGESEVTIDGEKGMILIPFTYWSDYSVDADGYGYATISWPASDDTAIKNIKTATSNAIYNLYGVQMNSNNLPRGVYIINGKKIRK